MYYIESVNIYNNTYIYIVFVIMFYPIVLRYKKFRNDKIIKKTMNFEIIRLYHLCVWWYKLCGVLTL